jgi:predicted DNA-binding helix-hairpin-helix protein
MDLEQKLDILAPAAKFDACDTLGGGRRFTPQKAAWSDGAIVAEAGPDGRARPTFRLLMSSRCEWSCAYCPLRSGNDDAPRATLTPEELAAAFLPRAERGAAQGLLLSTAVDGNAPAAADRMLDGVEHLRTKHAYTGYVHVKLLPGIPRQAVERAAKLADRISINLEAPSAAHLARVSPERSWNSDLIERLVWARDFQRAGALPSGLATQFVVGAAGESDRELLLTTAWLYRELELRRVYYGAFRPARGTPLEELLPTPFVREQRLKEADWLMRHYGFAHEELPYDATSNLPLHHDPKLAWALAHPERFPVELNTAAPETLLRVPGLGPVAVRRIVRLRRDARFRDQQHLKALGAAATRAIDFITLNGRFFGRDAAARARHYAARRPIAEQLSLW